jgi:hypothetical protein
MQKYCVQVLQCLESLQCMSIESPFFSVSRVVSRVYSARLYSVPVLERKNSLKSLQGKSIQCPGFRVSRV